MTNPFYGTLLAVAVSVKKEESIKMTHSNSDGLEHTVKPCLAMALFPAMMANPLYAIFVGVSGTMWGIAYAADQINSFNSLFLSKSKEIRGTLQDVEPAKTVEQSKPELVAPTASKDAGRTARARKAHSHKRTNSKG
jgi:hypothetical protein